MSLFQSLLPVEGKNKVRNLSLVPTSVAVAAISQGFGRNDASTSLLRALNSLPTRWEQEIEKEANEETGEVDLVLNELLEEDADIEKLEMDFATELLLTELTYKVSDACSSKVMNLALSPIPANVENELKEYEPFEPFEYFSFNRRLLLNCLQALVSENGRSIGWRI